MEVEEAMNEHVSYQGNPETRGTAPILFFDAADELPPAGTKATPRPADRPREAPGGGGTGEQALPRPTESGR